MVKKVNGNDFSEIAASGAAVVDFSATWCGPCKMLAPVLDDVAAELDGKADFFNVDVDANGDLAMRYGIQSVPSILIFRNGEIAGQTVGFQPKQVLKKFIEDHIA